MKLFVYAFYGNDKIAEAKIKKIPSKADISNTYEYLY